MIFDGGRESWEDDGRERDIMSRLRRWARRIDEMSPAAWAATGFVIVLLWAAAAFAGATLPPGNLVCTQVSANSDCHPAGPLPVIVPPPEPGTLPDPKLTPGASYPVSDADLCAKVGGLTYEKRSRAALTARNKAAITRAYGQTLGQDGDHELDHLIPAALAGRSDASNVWWEPGRGHGVAFDYHVKDRLDDWAWRQVCVQHEMTGDQARALFTPDWRVSYCRYIGGIPCP